MRIEENTAGREARRSGRAPLAAALALAVGFLAAALGGPAAACGPASDCLLESGPASGRSYRLRLPPRAADAAPVGAVVYAHGHRGSAAGVMQNLALESALGDLGVALIALDSGGVGWRLPNRPSGGPATAEEEIAYVGAVLDDALARFPIDPDRLLISGFSSGGMMAWTIACGLSHRFAAAAPIAGTFWRPVPESCPTPPIPLMHIHGHADPVVPLTGRAIREAHQGEVGLALEMYASEGRLGPPLVLTAAAGLACERRANADGLSLDFCLFSGGHVFRPEHLALAWERLMAGR